MASSTRHAIFFLGLLSSILTMMMMIMQQCHADDAVCLEQGKRMRDNNVVLTNYSTISSPRNVFELGFFTPEGSTNKNRYLGIWYSNNNSTNKVVVWVANRDNPLHGSNGYLIIRDGSAELMDAYGSRYWSTDNPSVVSNSVSVSQNEHLQLKSITLPATPPSQSQGKGANSSSLNSTKLCLDDSGNLILSRGRISQRIPAIWQSFLYPTDTFLPGMDSGGSIDLTSWQSLTTPATGMYTLQLQLTILTTFLTATESIYWESADAPVNERPAQLSALLLGGSTAQNLRLVLDFTGQVQLWELGNNSWVLKWFEPKDRCSIHNVCGDFASCNSYNRLLCKCLPGFIPSAPANWNAGVFSGGCKLKLESEACGRDFSDDMFLDLPMMNVGKPTSEDNSSLVNCKAKCLNDCYCVAYSSDTSTLTGTGGESSCSIWTSTDLTGLQEEYPGGITLHARTTHSDIALTSRDCETCGTYSIPYPLSTNATCGDPSYNYFHCNTSTGQVGFSTSKGRFNVTFISPDTRTFTIQVAHANSCDTSTVESMVLSNMHSLPFSIKKCNVVSNFPSMDVYQPFIEVEIGWQMPPEPACTVSSDCYSWPHTTCKAGKGGKLRCTCVSKFHWDSSNLKCNRAFPIKLLISCIAAALAVILLAVVAFIYLLKRRRRRKSGSVELMGDNSERIDVPFFVWESILSATNKFADVNKLGTGGFGSVYRGTLPDGQEIAVKRLDSASVQGVEEFRTEVVLIAKLQHRNLVRLLGYCVKADEKILVYEYMPNGSLDSCLFDENTPVKLEWKKRFDIISGIARGLVYLHQDSRLRIIHRDLKPSNILLDEDLNPKISDFGIARIVEGKQTESSTIRVVGTYGYMSPEYAHEGLFSVKSDVFSFGVVVLETISGRRNSKMFIYEHGLNLLGYAWKLWSEDRGLEVADQNLRESCNASEVMKCIHVALLCVQEDPSDRPTMSTVVLMFSSENASLPYPKQPAFSTRKPPLETASSSSHDMQLTISTAEGR